MLDIVASYHCMQFPGKLMNQIWENGEKNFGFDFGSFGPNLGPKIFFVGFTSNRSKTSLQTFIVYNFMEN